MDQFCAACTSLPITRTSLAVREEKAKAAVQTTVDNDQKAAFTGAGAGTGVGEDSPLNGGYDERSGALGGTDPGPSIPQPAQASSSAFTPAHNIGGNAGNASSVDPPTHWSTCDLSNNREQDQQNGQFNDPHSSQHQSQHHTQQQQQQQQQQNYRWSESAGEPLSRRHSVDSSPKNIHEGRNYSPNGAGPDRSGYGNMSVKDSMMSNQNMSASTMNQQHRPSMASSLFAEGISRVMDFLSKSPSQKSSPTALQQQRSESAKTQSLSTQHLHAYGARNRANSYNDTEIRPRTNFFSPGSGFDGSDSVRNVPGNASSGHIQSSSGVRRQVYHQNIGGIDDYRRAPMASIEEKDGSKGMRLSESDEGFVLVDPTPLPAAPHPWRGNGGGTSVLSGKHNYSSSGRPQNAFYNTNSPGNGTGAGTGTAWADGPGRDQYDTANQKSPSQRSAQPGQQMQATQGSQYHLQAQQSTPDTQHNRTSSASSSTKEKDKDKDKDRDRDRDRDRSSRSELSLPQFNENEKFAIAGMTQRSEYVCQVVMSIVRVGDCMAKEILAIEKKKDFFVGNHDFVNVTAWHVICHVM
jgi:hypothetical protein